jgi:hypothetical protein
MTLDETNNIQKDPSLMLTYDLRGSGISSGISWTPTMEERRAFLGCFLMNSVHVYFHRRFSQANVRKPCSTLRKGSTLRWTAYSNQWLCIIERKRGFEFDALLIQLGKLRLISEKVNDLPWSSTIAEVGNAMGAPPMFCLKSLESQPQYFKSNIPSNSADNSKSFHFDLIRRSRTFLDDAAKFWS